MRSVTVRTLWRPFVAGAAVAIAIAICPGQSRADEGGVSAWLPGTYGSLVAAPGTPGFSFALSYFHSTVAGGGAAFLRGRSLVVGLNGDANLGFVTGTYVAASPILGAQFSFTVATAFGRPAASISGTLTGPLGNVITGSRSEAITSFSDLFPTATLKWNYGVHNVMTYLFGVIPIGDYRSDRLSNTGIGHGALDWGMGYTYFDPRTGREFSVVAGLTYNFTNPDTQYQNGIDFHLDWGASQFVTKQLQIGLVGYFFQQLTCDSGAGATSGCFESRVAGIGPQIGYIIPMGAWQGYVNLKGYWEFAHENRPEGWNVWLTFAISPAAEPPPQVALARKY